MGLYSNSCSITLGSMSVGNQAVESAQAARQTLAKLLSVSGDLLTSISGGGLDDVDDQQLAALIKDLERGGAMIARIVRRMYDDDLTSDLPSRRNLMSVLDLQARATDELLRLSLEEAGRRMRWAARAGRRRSSERRAGLTGQAFRPPPPAQPRTAAARASARSVRSQVKSGSSRPK
jgi:hypothetical protein